MVFSDGTVPRLQGRGWVRGALACRDSRGSLPAQEVQHSGGLAGWLCHPVTCMGTGAQRCPWGPFGPVEPAIRTYCVYGWHWCAQGVCTGRWPSQLCRISSQTRLSQRPPMGLWLPASPQIAASQLCPDPGLRTRVGRPLATRLECPFSVWCRPGG